MTAPNSTNGDIVAARLPNDTVAAVHRYSLFGLVIDSAILLPELKAGDADAPVDLTIEVGGIEVGSAERSNSAQILTVDGVARYWVLGGNAIIVEPEAVADETNIRLFLLGTAMGIVLHQRGMLPLHANAIEIDGCAVAFMGPSGIGKSTLADWFMRQGLRMLADDVCAIQLIDGVPMVAPGIPRLRLWEDAIVARGGSLEGLNLSFAGDPAYRKFDVPLPESGGTASLLPLAAVYLLDRGPVLRLAPLAGVTAAQALFANTYRGEYVRETGAPRSHLEICLAVASATHCFRAVRRWCLIISNVDNQRLLDHAREQISVARIGLA